MFTYKALLAGFIICTGLASALAQQASPSIPFLQPGTAARSAGLIVNPDAVAALRQTTQTVKLTGVPLVTGAAVDFALQPAKIFADDANLVMMQDNDTTGAMAMPDIRAWYGTAPEHPGTRMFISANESLELKGMILGDERTSVTVINRDDAAPDGVYQIEANNIPTVPFCSDSRMPPGGTIPTEGMSARSSTMFDIELTLDVAHDLYRQLGRGNEELVSYLTDLIGGVNLIYRRDLQANFVVKDLFVWDTPDPFSAVDRDSPPNPAITTNDQLDNYFDYIVAARGGYSWDLTHLLDAKPGLGGVAYLNVLQGGNSAYRSGVSNVYGSGDFPGDPNTYYWDTMVLAHELGHNVGSPHTHCYTPPADCCATQSCSGCGTATPSVGSLMSYCHQWIGNGGGMVMIFHERSIAMMRPLIESSPLLSVHPSGPDLRIMGVGDLTVSGLPPHKASTLRSYTVGGSPVNQTFIIENTGDTNLVLTGNPLVAISGSPLLTVTSQPPATTLTPGQRTSFIISYNPQAGAPVSATVTIPTNRPVTPNFTFTAYGQVVQQSPPITASFSGSMALSAGVWHTVPFEVVGVPGWISDVDLRFNGTNCSIATETGLQHPWVGDLQMLLESPEGIQITVMNSPGIGINGSDGDNFCNTLLDDSAGVGIQSITGAGAPYSGSFRPLQPFSTFAGQQPNGFWSLYIRDPITADDGILRSVSLIVRGEIVTGVDDWTLY